MPVGKTPCATSPTRATARSSPPTAGRRASLRRRPPLGRPAPPAPPAASSRSSASASPSRPIPGAHRRRHARASEACRGRGRPHCATVRPTPGVHSEAAFAQQPQQQAAAAEAAAARAAAVGAARRWPRRAVAAEQPSVLAEPARYSPVTSTRSEPWQRGALRRPLAAAAGGGAPLELSAAAAVAGEQRAAGSPAACAA